MYMNITKKIKVLRKLVKEIEGEVEDNTNYFMMHNRKYYVKKGKLYTSTQYGKPIGSITMKGDIEMHKRHKRSKTHKVSSNLTTNMNSRSSNNLSRRINLNKNKNKKSIEESPEESHEESPEESQEPDESTTVTNLSRNTVMHETEEPELPTAPVNEQENEETPDELPESEEPVLPESEESEEITLPNSGEETKD
jgi:hypothetical protein